VKGWKVCQRNRSKHKDRAERQGVRADRVDMEVMVGLAVDTVVRGVKADRVAVDREVQAGRADVRAESGSISARRRFASSASRRWTSSTTSAPTFCRSSCRSAGRFCLAV
jgi:hypothetical protein